MSEHSLVWPLNRWHYLTISDDVYVPYYSSSQMLIDSPFAETEATEPSACGRIFDYRTMANLRVTERWTTLREVGTAIGVDNLACLGRALKLGVDHGLLVRERRVVTIKGKPVMRWFYARKRAVTRG